MPNAHALHIALNAVDAAHYKNLRPLRGAINDARLMETLTREAWGFRSATRLYDTEATSGNVLDTLKTFAGQLKSGDLLLVTYSGHGGLVRDEYWKRRGKDEEYDQTWCLYDRQLLDDELYAAFSQFGAGVRITVISDSCHSGTVTREIKDMKPEDAALVAQGFVPKGLDKKAANAIYQDSKAQYDGITARFKNQKPGKGNIPASVKLFAACQDDQSAYDSPTNGRFTLALKNVLEQPGAGEANAKQFFERIKGIYTYPNPNLYEYGAKNPEYNAAFPFALRAPAVLSPERFAPSIVVPDVAPVEAPDGPPKPPVFLLTLDAEDKSLEEEQIRKIFSPGLRSFTRSASGEGYKVELDSAPYDSEWSAVLEACRQSDALNLNLGIEPARTRGCDVVFYPDDAKDAKLDIDWLERWPPKSNAADLKLGWHLGDDYSQLASARDRVWQGVREGRLKPIRIAHIDTGYDRYHPAFRQLSYVQHDLAKSFLSYENYAGHTGALDVYYGDGEQQGHGLGTLALLAGGRVTRELTQGDFEGIIGFVPFAHVIPMRIAESVVILDTANFCEAMEYAIELKCEVVTMSMAGKPSSKMAKVINKAYERGITIVSAAGNSWAEGVRKVTPNTVLYPARFPRVLAACGVCQNQLPYDFEARKLYGPKGGDNEMMQGNWGPATAMNYALAAYTPNLPWASNLKDDKGKPLAIFQKGGGGTSSATPQIAAAAALWIMENRDKLDKAKYSGTWKQVEAVRRVLFDSADKTTFDHSKQYYGNGILKAHDALDWKTFPVIEEKHKAPPCESSWWGLSEMAKLLVEHQKGEGSVSNLTKALALELLHVLFSDPALAGLAESVDFSQAPDAAMQEQLLAAVRGSAFASAELKGMG